VLEKFGTWRLEKPPPNVNIVKCHWTFVVKCNTAGAIACYYACLVAQGFSQIPGIDFLETYVPIVKMALMRALFTMLACHDFEIHQINIKSAYLNGEFDEGEIIYMCLPPGIKVYYFTLFKCMKCGMIFLPCGLHSVMTMVNFSKSSAQYHTNLSSQYLLYALTHVNVKP